ncbi:hypothetical protein AAG906_020775 [Vitis piasezkii]
MPHSEHDKEHHQFSSQTKETKEEEPTTKIQTSSSFLLCFSLVLHPSCPVWRITLLYTLSLKPKNDQESPYSLYGCPESLSLVCRPPFDAEHSNGVQITNKNVDRLKARLVVKVYTQVYGSDYGDTFFLVAKIASVHLLLSMFIWSNHRFYCSWESGLVCRLRRSLYGLKQSPQAWFSHFRSVVKEFDMFHSTVDHSVFYHHNSSGQCIYLVVYVDDIVITGNNQNDIQKLKQHIFTHFQTKDLGKLKYFLEIEIAQSSSDVVLSQRKYVLDILEETSMLDCKPVDIPMDPNVKLILGQRKPLGDPGRYQQLVGKLNYLTITRPNISFLVSVVSQFLQSPCDSHWDVVIRILRYIKSTPGQGVLYENRGHTQVVGYRCRLGWLTHR